MPRIDKAAMKFPRVVIAGILLVFTGGCSRPAIPDLTKVLPVRGTLIYKASPVEGAFLVFYSEDSDEAGFCWSDAEGRFAVMTNDTAGIFPGEYLVTVSHPKGGVPENYADPERTPLWITVEEGQEQGLLITLEN